jgi:hypothetical protein
MGDTMMDRNRNTPFFPNLKKITMEDKPLFDRYLREFPPEISEHTFTNLFMWRYCHDTSWTLWNDLLCILMRPGEAHPVFLSPLGRGDVRGCIVACLDHFRKRGVAARFERVPESLIRQGVAEDPALTCEPDAANYDYVYLAEKLIGLPGRKLHSKRNYIRRFKDAYDYRYKPLDSRSVLDCLLMESEWCNLRRCQEIPGLACEEGAITEALMHLDALKFRGGLIFIEGKLEAFALGEPLNEDTAVIHVEKANPKITGLYPMINQAFCEAEWSGFTYINREQDLGEEGLRRAKESYQPHHQVKKYVVRLAEDA